MNSFSLLSALTLFSGMSLTIIVLLAWSIAWKGMALWKAAKNDSKPWFIAFLLINTLGILEILYIYIFSGSGTNNSKKKVKK